MLATAQEPQRDLPPNAAARAWAARLRALITAVLLIGAAFAWHKAPPQNAKLTPGSAIDKGSLDAHPLLAIARAQAPSGTTVQPASGTPGIFEACNADGMVVWRGVATREAGVHACGYAGDIDLFVGINASGVVDNVRLLEHRETPTFVRGIEEPWFLQQFTGKSAESRLEPFADIDGITHATVSITAICEAVRRSIAIVNTNSVRSGTTAPAAAGPAPTGAANRIRTHDANAWGLAAVLGLLCLRRRVPPPVTALGVVLIIGFVVPQYLSLAHVRLALTGPSAWATLPLATAVFLVVALGLALSAPRGYCTLLCPLGRLQELLAWRRDPAAVGTVVPLAVGRGLAWLGLALLVVAPQIGPERLEVFGALFMQIGGLWGGLFAATTLLGAVLTPRFYCRSLCPLNALFVDLETAKAVARPAPTTSDPADLARLLAAVEAQRREHGARPAAKEHDE